MTEAVIIQKPVHWFALQINREASPLIRSANQWTGFYMIIASVMKESKLYFAKLLGVSFLMKLHAGALQLYCKMNYEFRIIF